MLTATLLATLAAAVVTDLCARRIPDAITVPAALLALAFGAARDPVRLAAGAGAAACAAATAYGAGLALRRGLRAARGATVPFAPFLAVGALWACVAPP